jgi:hypothetical protein
MVALALSPVVAEAHGLTGAGGWTDELVFLVPTAVLLVLVFAFGGPMKHGERKSKDGK